MSVTTLATVLPLLLLVLNLLSILSNIFIIIPNHLTQSPIWPFHIFSSVLDLSLGAAIRQITQGLGSQ